MVKISRERAAELRIELLDAAAFELRRVGYDAMALTAVAARCGIATSAIYNRFSTKEALVEALLEERIEPSLGSQLDAEARAFWSGTSTTFTVDFEKLGTVSELLLAARHTPSLHTAVFGFVRRRVDVALEAREEAERRGAVRTGQSPHVQTMLRAASWIGTYICGLASAPPFTQTAVINELIRMTVLTIPFDSPLPHEAPSTPRSAPTEPSLDDHNHDDICQALVDAAADVFAENGYDASSVADIARRAGLTTGAIYNRFPSKADLMNEVLLTHIGPSLQTNGVDLAEVLGAPAEVGNHVFSEIVERFNDLSDPRNRGLRLAARDAARHEPEVAKIVGPLQDTTLVKMADSVRASQKAGRVRSDIDPELLAWWVCVNPLGVSLLRGAYPEIGLQEWAKSFMVSMEILRTQPN